MLKISIFIAARTESTRLPRKHLLTIYGRELLAYLLDRLKLAKKVGSIVVCTTTKEVDNILVELAKREGVDYFRGSENDILLRFLMAAKEFNVDYIIVADGDDPFSSVRYIDGVAELFLKDDPDFIECKGLPLGAAPFGIKVSALDRVVNNEEFKDRSTGWIKFLSEHGDYRLETINADKEYNLPEARLTLDYPEDFVFIRTLFRILHRQGNVILLEEVVKLLKDEPYLMDINNHKSDDYWKHYKKQMDELQ